MNDRYSRQEIFPEIGKSGQKRISSTRLAVVGCGALGSVSSEMLVRAGVGYTRIIDRDFVEYSNLQRQSLFQEKHAREGTPKAVAAVEALRLINSEVEIEGLVADITPRNISDLLNDVDLIVDGSDNFEIRFLINDYSIRFKKPWFYAASLGSFGSSFPIVPGKTPCFRCFFNSPPDTGSIETCETAGIISPIIHAVVSYQVTQVIKFIVERSISSEILQLDIWNNEWRKVKFEKPLEDCICCSDKQFEFLNGELRSGAARLCGRNAVQITPVLQSKFNFDDFSERFDNQQLTTKNDYLIRLELDGLELTLFRDGRAIIKGTDDISVARSLYSKYVGC